MTVKIRLAHSPDPDDAFMFYAIARGLIDTGPYEFVHEMSDIESLNRRAMAGELEVTAISFHAYAYVARNYLLLPHGASFGDGYGPMVISRSPRRPGDIRGARVAVPGKMTSAFLALKLAEPDFEPVFMNFERIIPAVLEGETEMGLIIHEGQLTYAREGLHLVLDTGGWWKDKTGLPLPLGGNAIRRDLGEKTTSEVASILRNSIDYALSHRREALEYALGFGRGLSIDEADRFVGMYVNRWTQAYGEEGEKAVKLFLSMAYKAGLVPENISPSFCV